MVTREPYVYIYIYIIYTICYIREYVYVYVCKYGRTCVHGRHGLGVRDESI